MQATAALHYYWLMSLFHVPEQSTPPPPTMQQLCVTERHTFRKVVVIKKGV